MNYYDISEISFSDGIGLIALVVAINASITFIYIWAAKLNKQKLKKNVINLECHMRYTERVVNAISDVVVLLESRLTYLEGLQTRILFDSNKEIYEKAKSQISFNRNKVMKANNEMLLDSPNREYRISAYKYLANSIGDYKSLEKMKSSIIENEANCDVLIKYVDILKERLDSIVTKMNE